MDGSVAFPTLGDSERVDSQSPDLGVVRVAGGITAGGALEYLGPNDSIALGTLLMCLVKSLGHTSGFPQAPGAMIEDNWRDRLTRIANRGRPSRLFARKRREILSGGSRRRRAAEAGGVATRRLAPRETRELGHCLGSRFAYEHARMAARALAFSPPVRRGYSCRSGCPRADGPVASPSIHLVIDATF
jgi:hypothetical protein